MCYSNSSLSLKIYYNNIANVYGNYALYRVTHTLYVEHGGVSHSENSSLTALLESNV